MAVTTTRLDRPTAQRGLLVPLTLGIGAALGLLLVLAARLMRGRSIRLRVPARFESIRWLVSLLDELAREAQLNEQAIFQCRLALDEACANIIRHAYANDPSGEIEAHIRAGKRTFTIRLTDFGEPYDPATLAAAPATVRGLDNARPGGLGLHLMRSVMDEVRYTPGPRGNHLVMVKHCRPH